MIKTRKSEDRGFANYGWLDTRYSFSFANYFDHDYMGFGHLRVINEDFIEGGKGFDMHPHSDMEIVTYIIEGRLEHRDSMGNGSIIRRGDIQRMSAGTGVTHSERNPLSEPTHLLQIWLLPSETGITPGYEEKNFREEAKKDQLQLLVSPDGREESLSIHQDVDLYSTILSTGKILEHTLADKRCAWVQMISGEITLNEITAKAGDGLEITDENILSITAEADAEFLLFDMGIS